MTIQSAFVMLQSLRGETPRHVERFTPDFSDAYRTSRHAPAKLNYFPGFAGGTCCAPRAN
jgi:hypothetical protein